MDLYDFDARVAYLRLAAYDIALEEIREERPRAHVSEVEITQVGKTGFHFKDRGEVISQFVPWTPEIRAANENFF